MSANETRALLFVESNTSGTGRLFVQRARELGYRPVLITTRPEKYAYLAQPGAPEVVVVPRTDEDELAALIESRFGGRAGVAGVASSSEYFVATAAALAARFGLPAADAAAVRAARDKSHQRKVLAEGGVASPAFRAVADPFGAVAAAREIGFPVVLKPVDGSGSAGVRACADAAEVEAHASKLFAENAGRRVLVEELIRGPEFSVEVFSGRVIGITRKHLGPPPAFVEAGHDYPAEVAPAVADALIAAVARGTALLGLGWGPLHWELRVTDDGRAVPMEVNPRLAGGFIPELVRLALGIDLVRETVRLAAGHGPPALTPIRRRQASIRFLFAPHAGKLRSVDGIEAAREMDGVADVALYRSMDDELTIEHDFRDRVGHVIAVDDDPSYAPTIAEAARDLIHLRVERSASPENAVLAGAAGGVGR